MQIFISILLKLRFTSSGIGTSQLMLASETCVILVPSPWDAC